MFTSILGNAPIKAYLEKAILEERLPQTLLFSGPDGIGKSLFAKEIAKKLLNTDKLLDLHILSPEGKSGLYSIEPLRQMMEIDQSASFEGKGKVFILKEAHRMQPVAANALLKTLEEPSSDSTFILITSGPREILPTVLSRASHLEFLPLSLDEVEEGLRRHGHPIQFAKLASGSIGKALELASSEDLEKPRTILFELLRKTPPYPELCLKLNEIETLLQTQDPVRFASQIENIFSLILMWHRDQMLKELEGSPEHLFFPDEPKAKGQDLESLQKVIETAKTAFSRNIKLSQVLLLFFS